MRFIEFIGRDVEHDILLENKATYRQMMQGVLQAWQQLDPARAQRYQEEAVKWQKVLKRADRIVWYLRWLRLDAIVYYVDAVETGNIPEEQRTELLRWGQKAMNKFVGEMSRATGSHEETVRHSLDTINGVSFETQMQHFMSYTDQNSDTYIAAIAETVFEYQMPDDIIYSFSQAEKKWQDTRSRELDPADEFYSEAEKVIDFGDGFAWWNLNVSQCSAEGSSMGHCGNRQGMAGDDDRIFSLRQDVVKQSGERKQVPRLTFILDGQDMLGEMKGRANTKPKEEYHKYIVPLLMSDYVDGIKGGGHAPESNFQVTDLDQEQMEKLIAVKPGLEPLGSKYRRIGFSPEMESAIYDAINKHNFPEIEELDEKTVYLKRWDDLEELSNDQDYDLDELNELVAYLELKDEDWDDSQIEEMIETFTISEDTMLDVLHYLPDDVIGKIAASIGIDGDPQSRKVKTDIALNFRGSKYDEPLRRAIVTSSKNDIPDLTEGPQWEEYIDLCLTAISYGFRNFHASLDREGSEVVMTMPLDQFVAVVDLSEGDEYDEDAGIASEIKYTSEWGAWQAYDTEEYTKSLRGTNDYDNYHTGKDEVELFRRMSKMVEQATTAEVGAFKKPSKPDPGPENFSLVIQDFDPSDMEFNPREVALKFMDWLKLAEAEQSDDLDQILTEILRRFN